MKTFSLKFRFAIAMSFGALALVIGMGAISMYFAQEDLLSTLSSQQLGLVSRAAEDLDTKLKLAIDTLTATATSLPPDSYETDAKFDAFFAQNTSLLQMFDDLLVLDDKGIIKVDYPTRYDRLGLDLSERSYVQRAMADGKPAISDPLRGKASGDPLIAIAVPIVDHEGRTLALMVGLLRLERRNFLGTLASDRIGETGYFAVATSGPDAIYLAHPDASRLMQRVPRDRSRAMAEALGATAPGVTISTLDDGSEVLISYRPLKQTNWIITAILPGAEAFAAIDRSRERTIAIGIATALIVLPLVWLIAWRMLRPLTVLRKQVEGIAGDPQGTAFTSVGNHEIGQVAEAFNAMLAGQRRSEAARIASDQDRRRLVAILESSQDFVAMTDTEGRVTYLNASGRLNAGVGLNDDLRHTGIVDYFPPWAAEKLATIGVPAALKDGLWIGETAVLGKDGREIPVDHTIIAHRNVDGQLEFFSSLLHDTSVAKAQSAAMRSSEARMLSIANALPMLVAFIDCDYRYRFINARYEEHFGVGKSLMLGKSVVDLVGQKAYQAYLPFLQRASRGEMQVFEIESHAGVRPAHFLVKLIPQFDDASVLTGYHFLHQDVTVHKAEQQRLSQLVRADALTGLLNRAGFEVAIDEAMHRSQLHGASMALFYLDVDRFKSINDRHGHLVGDALLRAFADRLVAAVRGADVAARLGGDEFVVIAEGLRSLDDVRAIAKKILRAMRPAFVIEGQTMTITASIGVAAYAGGAMRADELIRRADAALYRAKNAGRDRYDLDDPAEAVVPASIESGEALELTVIH